MVIEHFDNYFENAVQEFDVGSFSSHEQFQLDCICQGILTLQLSTKAVRYKHTRLLSEKLIYFTHLANIAIILSIFQILSLLLQHLFVFLL